MKETQEEENHNQKYNFTRPQETPSSLQPPEIVIHPDKKTTLIFQFLYNPEYIGVGNNIIINMDNLKAFGKIKQLIPEKIDGALASDKKNAGLQK